MIKRVRTIFGEWLIELAVFHVIPDGDDRVVWAKAVKYATRWASS